MWTVKERQLWVIVLEVETGVIIHLAISSSDNVLTTIDNSGHNKNQETCQRKWSHVDEIDNVR